MREYLKFYIDGQWVDPVEPRMTMVLASLLVGVTHLIIELLIRLCTCSETPRASLPHGAGRSEFSVP